MSQSLGFDSLDKLIIANYGWFVKGTKVVLRKVRMRIKKFKNRLARKLGQAFGLDFVSRVRLSKALVNKDQHETREILYRAGISTDVVNYSRCESGCNCDWWDLLVTIGDKKVLVSRTEVRLLGSRVCVSLGNLEVFERKDTPKVYL